MKIEDEEWISLARVFCKASMNLVENPKIKEKIQNLTLTEDEEFYF